MRREFRGWCIVATGFLVEALAIGGRSLFLIVILLWAEEDYISWSRSELSGLMALVHICNGLTTPFSGYFVDKLPPYRIITISIIYLALCYGMTSLIRTKLQAYIIYGAMTGCAFGSLNLNVFSSTIMRMIPSQRKGLAVGISTSGSTFGQFILVPLFAATSRTYGWRRSFLGLGLCTFIISFPAYILLQNNHDNVDNTGYYMPTDASTNDDVTNSSQDLVIEQKDDQDIAYDAAVGYTAVVSSDLTVENDERLVESRPCIQQSPVDSTDENKSCPTKLPPSTTLFVNDVLHILSSTHYYSLAISFFICGVTTTGFIESHFIAYLVDNGNYSMNTGSAAFSLLSICNGFAIIISGYLSDKMNKYKLLCCIFALRGLCFLLLIGVNTTTIAVKHPWLLWLFSIIFGIVDYSVVPPTVALCEEYYPHLVGIAMGILLLIHSLGAAVGSALAGYDYDITGTYEYSIYTCACICMIAAIGLWFHNYIFPLHTLVSESNKA